MKKVLLILGAIIMLFAISNKEQEEVYVIPNNAIRFRIIANSNSIKDQHIKKVVKERLEKEILKTTISKDDKEQAKIAITNKLEDYDKIVKETLEEQKEPIDYKISFGKNHFPEKIYKGLKYEEGDYDSLVITLGKGDGDNWWCVLFPPICSLEQQDTTSDVEYKFFITEIVKKYILNDK